MRPVALLALAAGATFLSSCASLGPATCPAGQSPGRTVELFFGRNIGDRLGVSEADFQRFVDEELTPRFPDGLTVVDAAGQWRGASGLIGREPSKLVILVLLAAPATRASLTPCARPIAPGSPRRRCCKPSSQPASGSEPSPDGLIRLQRRA